VARRLLIRGAPALALAAALGLACVAGEQQRLNDAREAWERCLERDAPGGCEAERARYQAASREYEERARSAWGCDPAQEECPTPR